MSKASINTYFSSDPEFCPCCGALLRVDTTRGPVNCIACKLVVPEDRFVQQVVKYTVKFNRIREAPSVDKSGADGPVVERKCRKCGHNKMSYAALQLRSADEGQTVFFTCLKCGFKENENS